MTGTAINTKTEALELHELSSEKLDAVSGGGGGGKAPAPDPKKEQDKENAIAAQEFNRQWTALRIYRQMLNTF